MRTIGLTGGIGTGKSTVGIIISELGASVIDADKIGHEVLASSEIRKKLIKEFGEDIMGIDSMISREKLAEIAFSKPENRRRLNQITHPAIYRRVKARLEELRRQKISLAVVEAALLIEAGWSKLVDEIWVTTASRETVLQRLIKRGGMTEDSSIQRIASQLPPEEQTKHANVVVDTDTGIEELREKIKKLLEEFKARYA